MRRALAFAGVGLALWIVAGIAVYAAHSTGAPPTPSCWVVPAPIKNLVVMEPDRIICPVDRGRN
jgi:hypothetical protein